jgi:sugar lactone lactonase YvrE
MPLGDFTLTPGDISFHGAELSRPECVVAERDGTLWCSDDRGGLTRIGADGRVSTIGSIKGAPNGFAPEKGGSFLVANIEDGKVYRLYRNGQSEMVLDTFEGAKLGSANFVYRDGDRFWITVSTRTEPRRKAMEQGIADGFVLLYENGKARLAAQDIVFTNEVRVDRARKHLYVAETGKGRVLRYALRSDGSLGPAETYGPPSMFPGARIDGITFDAEGNLWVTEITRNGLYVIAPDGACRQVFEDPSGKTVDFPASVVFAGPDLKTAYVGSIRMKRLAMFRSPVAGEPLDHWNDR